MKMSLNKCNKSSPGRLKIFIDIFEGWADAVKFLSPLHSSITRTVAPLSLGQLSLAKWCKGMLWETLENVYTKGLVTGSSITSGQWRTTRHFNTHHTGLLALIKLSERKGLSLTHESPKQLLAQQTHFSINSTCSRVYDAMNEPHK